MSIILDASAILAFLNGEPGGDTVGLALQAGDCCVTAANHCEVVTKALDRGVEVSALMQLLAQLDYTVIDVTAEDGMVAGLMRPSTRALGLSLGDRLCLAAAKRLHAPVLTADRPWLGLAPSLGLDIRSIRPDAH